MNSRKVVYLFFSTLLIGATSGALVGFILDWRTYWEGLMAGEVVDFFLVIVWLFGIGAMWTLISQMGFFAYLTVHRFALGFFKTARTWNMIQVVIIAFVLQGLGYFRYVSFGTVDESILGYILIPLFLLIYGLCIAYYKSKQTNFGAFIPALFFIVVVTTLEWLPALRVNDPKWLWVYFTPLLVANTWQLLVLHRLINRK
ncbi:KinB-signaling pathway activation protein [Anaerobacillus isosaccharinicus]|uniref:KinB activator protein n=1 Tax=Anaerobacillus isosaccharinicus TaxID=1532552 RepID=A0A1S2MD49_9BACI|nr:KinB-signaling pathway activation protein [Anaerobacillus isosaccharinicus]MBA5584014.1 KinB-signaling pathway activation protein [Anaerobacillus isosaccharinicus]QOY37570.1 KinB-signaling pathway activation protein [Anaerobacillus isosaccharinicus]